MFLITCQHKDCPTPQFLVNPKAGKIILAVGLDLSELSLNVAHASIRMKTKVDGLMGELSTEIENLNQTENDSLKKKLIEFLSGESSNSTLPTIKKLENVTDYLVVGCPSNHRNYIALGEDNTENEN